MRPNTATETELIGVLERFFSAFADRDAEAVERLFAPTDDIVVVASEAFLAARARELRRFLDRYVDGPTTYS